MTDPDGPSDDGYLPEEELLQLTSRLVRFTSLDSEGAVSTLQGHVKDLIVDPLNGVVMFDLIEGYNFVWVRNSDTQQLEVL